MKLIPLRGGRNPRLRRALAASTALLIGAGIVVAAATQASAATGCRVTYTVNQWSTGFTANLAITNLGDPITSWDLRWSFAGNQQITQAWSSRFSQSGQQVSLTNEAWNGSLGTNASTNPGFNATYSGTNAIPTSFTLNGTACTGSVTGGPTSSPTSSPTGGPSTSPTGGPPPNRVANPFAGARAYVNPDWAANARSSGGSAIANQPTFVWMDRIAAIAGTSSARGLRSHLDTALQQGATLFQVVTYNLPGRDCAALASNGELKLGELNRYKTEFIDPIAAILGDPKYANIRIVNIVEIDSLPNLITNVSSRPTGQGTTCDQAKSSGDYVNGVAYTLGKLGAIPNVYNYVDIGHHGWLGWDDNFQPFADLMGQVVRTAPATPASLFGFATNVANYGATHEPYFSINDTVGGRAIREVPVTEGGWIDWNRYIDEASYAIAYRPVLGAAVGHQVSMIIDTSRNGWGNCTVGPCQPNQTTRPTAKSTSTNPVTYMNQSRTDKRIHLGNWCNQTGAGLGERPRANPEANIDAYVWVKPPGESDGSSTEIANDEGKGFDRMCDPTYTGNVRNANQMSGALPGAPVSGHWFDAQFRQLMANAFPPL